MARMPELFLEVERDAAAVGRGITGLFDRHHAADAAPETPAAQPVNLAPATAAAATPQEEPMSVITDLEDGYAAVKSELGKFEQALPGALAKAKQFEASPFAAIAEKAAASVLPPEAVAIAVNGAEKVLDDLISLYAPATPADPAPTGQQPVQAPAQ